MASATDVEVTKQQLTKDIFHDLGIEEALVTKYPNPASQAGQLIDEYGKYFRQLFRYVAYPYGEPK